VNWAVRHDGFKLVLILLALAGCSTPSLACPIPAEMMSSPPEDVVRVTFQNNSCTTVCALYISPGNCDNWGFDWLEDANLPSGAERTLALHPGRYDILVEDCTQAEYQGLRYTFDADETVPFSGEGLGDVGACTTSLTVVNETEMPVCYLWMGAPTSESFGRNWLGEEEIASGGSFTVTVPPGIYDLKAEGCEFELLGLWLDAGIEGERIWTLE